MSFFDSEAPFKRPADNAAYAAAVKQVEDDKNKKDLQNGCLYFLIGILLFIPVNVWTGFVLKQMWSWFIEPIQIGTAHIGPIQIWQAVGICALVQFFTSDWIQTYRNEEEAQTQSIQKRFWVAVSGGILLPAVFLGFGAIYHSFMS